MPFLPRRQVKSFHFTDCFFDEETNTAHLRYAFNGSALVFEETLDFCQAPLIRDERQRQAVNLCLRLLHIAAGISYYKLYIPDEIKLDSTVLTKKEAEFFNLFYTSGLGEFSYRNNVRLNIRFPFDESVVCQKAEISLKKRVVVPVGGGKDSIVTIEALKHNGFQPVLFSVGNPLAIQETIRTAELPSILVKRHLSENLIALNRQADQYGAFNGHVPVTGIIAFILMLSAVLYDFSDAALSNERSANIGNTQKDGRTVNHQWSKSLEFEQAFRSLTLDVLPEFRYFSLLRALSELSIAALFSRTRKYDFVFTSCNKAFKLDEKKRLDHWCADCDKCRFVFLALAPFMEKKKLIQIFSKNMLDDVSQIQGYKELLGLSAFKPFECVGEIEESALAFLLILDKPEWHNDKVIRALSNEVCEKYRTRQAELTGQVFSLTDHHLIPEEYKDVIRNFEKQTGNGMGERA